MDKKNVAHSTSCSENSIDDSEDSEESYDVLLEIKEEKDEDSESSAVSMACRICLTMDVKMYDLTDHRLGEVYHQITGIKWVDKDKLPQKVCWECAGRLVSGYKLSQKALESHKLLTGLLQTSAYLKMEDITSLRNTYKRLQSNLVKSVQHVTYDCKQCTILENEIIEVQDCIKKEPLEQCAADPLTTETLALISEDAQTEDPYEGLDAETSMEQQQDSETTNVILISNTDITKPTSYQMGKDVCGSNKTDNINNFQKPFEPYECHNCGKRFALKWKMRLHITRIHSGLKPFKCKECGKCFKNFYKLSQHSRTHTGQKPFKCNECGRCFSQKVNLKRHTKSHTGQKPYKCQQCGKCFTRNYTLLKHLRTQSGQKHNLVQKQDNRPYECKECGKTFTHSRYLVSHAKTHTGLKPYQCQECGKCFTRNHNLSSHIAKIHSGGKTKEFGKSIKDVRKLSVHLRSDT